MDCVFHHRPHHCHTLTLPPPPQQPNLPGLRARDIIAPLHYVSLTGITTASGNTVHNTLTHVVMDGDQLHLTGTVEGLLAAQKVSHTALTAVNTGVTRSTGVEQHLVQVVLSAKGGLLGTFVFVPTCCVVVGI